MNHKRFIRFNNFLDRLLRILALKGRAHHVLGQFHRAVAAYGRWLGAAPGDHPWRRRISRARSMAQRGVAPQLRDRRSDVDADTQSGLQLASATDGRRYHLLLGSTLSDASATRRWAELKRRNPELFAGMELKLRRVVLRAGHGEYYHILVGPVETRQAGLRLCHALRERSGQEGCIPIDDILRSSNDEILAHPMRCVGGFDRRRLDRFLPSTIGGEP